MNPPLRAPIAPKVLSQTFPKQQDQPPKPKPNDPFREAMRRFVGRRVVIQAHDGSYEGNLVCFDFASKAVVVKCEEIGTVMLSGYHSIRMAKREQEPLQTGAENG